jgi:hypothetical protein
MRLDGNPFFTSEKRGFNFLRNMCVYMYQNTLLQPQRCKLIVTAVYLVSVCTQMYIYIYICVCVCVCVCMCMDVYIHILYTNKYLLVQLAVFA